MESILNHNEISTRYFYPKYAKFENPFFVESDNNQLACYYHKVDNPKKTIIYFHGNGEVVANYIDSFFYNQIIELECSILFAEYRGYGLSTGDKPSLVSMLDDVEKIIKSINVSMEEIILFGRSVGSIYAIHGAFLFPDIAGLIIESGISDVVARVFNMIEPKELGTTKEVLLKEGEFYFNHKEKIKTFQGQTLIIHTKYDSLVSSSNAKALYKWANEPKLLKLFEKGDHNDIMFANVEEYFLDIKNFINNLGIKNSSDYLPKGYRLRDYEIVKILGSGGNWIIYLAKHIELETIVVIKEFLPVDLARRDKKTFSIVPFEDREIQNNYAYLIQKLLDEAKILASIRHINIVKVSHFFKGNNTVYFVMDYIDGKSLNYIIRKKSLDESKIISIILPILDGLKEVHNNRYLHRDIAPDNIYLKENGMPILIGFGMSANEEIDAGIDRVAIVKEGYSAPEQYSLDSNHTPAIDIYAMGSVIYTMISGKIAPESIQRQLAILNDNPDILEDIEKVYRGRYSKKLLQTIKKAMSLKPKDRFQNVTEMQRALIEGKGIPMEYSSVEKWKNKLFGFFKRKK